MKKFAFCLVLLIGAAYAGYVLAEKDSDELMQQAQSQFKPIPTELQEIEGITLTPERIELGKWLYFDPRLSKSWLISCNTCHNLALGGVDLEETSIGHGWAKGPRNAPTVLNSVFNIAQFWDGRAEDLQAQAKGPVQAGVEMNNTPERVEQTLKSIPEYVQRFRKAFPGDSNPVTFDNMADAIEAFEATLLTPGSPFDKYLNGDSQALSKAQKKGLKLFMNKGCSTCHNGINVGGGSYHPFGVVEKPGSKILPEADKGRFVVTETASDKYVFKVPSLRNIELTPPYFHSGQVWDLEQAVAIMGSSQLGIKLSRNETAAIVTFLKTLTGEQPRVEYPILPPHTKGTPLPVTGVSGNVAGH
ncbi:Cytochrome c peroxidase [Nitrosococcus oceani ATCC 19707]|uniref:Cytochrome c peroxidase n=2 Tax=Nitrosococcus oceani TaxID=1229 RepID=Q3JBN2_NITOC|nr:cytochrome-c peroxidase [Nitrosococcus oceani]ABA57764.1 Cytochrome c peroxidase [Nitrosococcus oceani ATCC 19707]EDZ68500.1 Di-haem cytochrome c peroxidase family [Nitrosococcus oceani AFC27]KFI19852.1 cytochrome C peroxidase [Nitrosococcus oceani C-27]GEM19418.1 cytochrome c biogenesis protein CcsA [Nitrosococcus oceani]